MLEIPVRKKGSRLNLTPLIDIVFLLLVFFLLTSHFVQEEGIGIRLPASTHGTRQDRGRITIRITREGVLYVNGRRTSDKDLPVAIEKLLPGSEGTVVIRGDRDADLQTVVSVMDAAKQAGTKHIVLATIQETGGP
jgi:biopolymer transport protein ExbD